MSRVGGQVAGVIKSGFTGGTSGAFNALQSLLVFSVALAELAGAGWGRGEAGIWEFKW